MALRIEDVAPLPKVQRDRPTATRPEAPKPPPVERPVKPKSKPKPAVDPLATPLRTVTNRVPAELWDQLGARATELGLPVRVLLTDAIMRVLEQPVDEHRKNAKATRRRERLARVDADD